MKIISVHVREFGKLNDVNVTLNDGINLKPLLAQLDHERAVCNGEDALSGEVLDHSAFLSAPQLTKRPEQLSVQDFVRLTNDISALYDTK